MCLIGPKHYLGQFIIWPSRWHLLCMLWHFDNLAWLGTHIPTFLASYGNFSVFPKYYHTSATSGYHFLCLAMNQAIFQPINLSQASFHGHRYATNYSVIKMLFIHFLSIIIINDGIYIIFRHCTKLNECFFFHKAAAQANLLSHIL